MSTESKLAERPQSVKAYLELPQYKARFGEVLGQRAPQFMAALVSISNQEQLARCEPRSIIASAMIAATLDLPIERSLGFAHIVGYAGVAQFQMAAKGYIQLALRSGQYQRLNAKPVNEEAFQGYDEVGEPKIDWSALDESKPTVGYAVAWKLTNGFTKVAYWSKKKVEAHAAQYSQAYKKKKMDSPWFTNFDKMALKTVMMNELRTYGPLSVQLQTAMKHDMGVQKDVDADVEYIDNDTGETGTTSAAPEEQNVTPQRAPVPEKKKKGAAAAQAAIEAEVVAPASEPAKAVEAPKPEAKPVEKAAEAPKAEPTPEPAKVAEAPKVEPATQTEPRAFIKDGEELVVDITVKSASPIFATMNERRAPSVLAQVTGQFNNQVIQHDIKPVNLREAAGKESFDLPAQWKEGSSLRLKLLGKMFPAVKKIYAVVQSVEAIPATDRELG